MSVLLNLSSHLSNVLNLFWVQTLLAFINYHLYHSIDVKYPPILDPRLEALASGTLFTVQWDRNFEFLIQRFYQLEAKHGIFFV